jgi:hypothetical protein
LYAHRLRIEGMMGEEKHDSAIRPMLQTQAKAKS